MSRILLLVLLCTLIMPAPQALAQGNYLDWRFATELPLNPGMNGLNGPFSGVHNGVLIVAGGADAVQGDSGTWSQQYHSEIMVGKRLSEGKIDWMEGGKWQLDGPRAYGNSVSTPEGLLCIGGMGEAGSERSVRLLRWDLEKEGIEVVELRDLPVAVAHGAGAYGEGKIYFAGHGTGAEEKFFWSLEVDGGIKENEWKTLPTWPGKGRSKASLSIQSNGIGKGAYLIGGEEYRNTIKGKKLNDAWRFDLGNQTWTQIADVAVDGRPYFPVSSPSINAGIHHVLVFAADGSPPSHPRTEILAYHTITNTWAVSDTAQLALPLATTANWWEGDIVLAGGLGSANEPLSTVWEISPIPAPSGMRWLDYVVIVLYLVILVAMGAHFMRRGKTTEDYFKAGRRIPWWAAGISIFGTSLSAITYMAVPAKAYSTDWGYVFLSMSQLLTVPLVIWLVLPFFRRLNVTTAYEYLERRFHVLVRVIGGIAFVIFQFGRIGIVLFLPAIALSVVTGVDIYTCIIVMAVLSIFYTVLGGIEAVIWTDVKQVVVLTLGAVVCLILMATGVEGGFDSMIDIAAGDGKMRLMDLDFDFHSPTLWVILGGGIGTNLINQTSDQTFVQRYLTTRDEKSAARSLLTPAALVLPISLLFFGLGSALYSFYKTHPEALNPVLENGDAIFPWYIVSQLPEGLSGLLIAGIFAASMSSLDSSLNSAATVITVDFYKRFRPGAVDRHYLSVAKVVTIVIGVVGMGFALLMAGYEIKSLWDEFSKILGLFAGGLAGLFLLGMSSRRATTGGALIGFLASAGIQYWVSSTAAVHFLLYTFTGLASCYVIGWLASWLFPKRTDLYGLTIGTIRKIQERKPESS